MQRLHDIFLSFKGIDLTFSKLDFWLFFLVVMLIFAALHKNKVVRSIYLTAVSLFFYYKTSGLSVYILMFTLLANYSLGIGIESAIRKNYRKILMAFAIILNILVLAYFKYAYFFTNSFNELFHTNHQVFNSISYFKNGFSTVGEYSIFDKLILPAGVSFFTFSSIAYIIDVYRKETTAVRHFFHFSFYISFFPHLILGPIVRAKEFIPQIQQPYHLDKESFGWAIFQILKGLFKKLILADYIAVHFIDKIVIAPESYPGFFALAAIIGYSVQIYGDFSGYTDMATGIARLMGFKLAKNFDSPYKSRNAAEFWRRWHISLGSWWKDYLYIPLGGNRTGGFWSIFTITIIFIFLFFITQWHFLFFIYVGFLAIYAIILLLFPNYKKIIYRDINLMITMTVGGLWHNPLQNYVIWGALNGLGLVFYNHWKKIENPESKNWIWVHILKIFLLFSSFVLLLLVLSTKQQQQAFLKSGFQTTWIVFLALALIAFLIHRMPAIFKKYYQRFWAIFITFMFMTIIRIWFRVEGKEEPFQYFTHMITQFNYSWNAYLLMWQTFLVPLILLLLGLYLHWLPDRSEEKLTALFIKAPFPLQIIGSCAFIIGIYQLIADTSKPFVYIFF